jgi:hypothetical protein
MLAFVFDAIKLSPEIHIPTSTKIIAFVSLVESKSSVEGFGPTEALVALDVSLADLMFAASIFDGRTFVLADFVAGTVLANGQTVCR